jgi:hypothetical protein
LKWKHSSAMEFIESERGNQKLKIKLKKKLWGAIVLLPFSSHCVWQRRLSTWPKKKDPVFPLTLPTSDWVRHRSQDICPTISPNFVLKNFIKISLIIKECPEEILIKLAIVLKISKSNWNTADPNYWSLYSSFCCHFWMTSMFQILVLYGLGKKKSGLPIYLPFFSRMFAKTHVFFALCLNFCKYLNVRPFWGNIVRMIIK